MIRIVSDTSTLYSTQQAKDAGFVVSPLSVTIAGNTYREFDEISAEEFVAEQNATEEKAEVTAKKRKFGRK